MIKNSKLIGTTIRPPTGWKNFKVGELFDVKSAKPRNYDELTPHGQFPYVVRSSVNNGIREYMNGPRDYLCRGNCITLGIDTASYFYQEHDFFAGVKIKALYLKPVRLTERLAWYLCNRLNCEVSGYGYSGGKAFNVHDFKQCTLELPSTADGQPDFGWMTQYMEAVKQQTLTRRELANAEQIKAYLTESGHDSYKDTVSDREFVQLWHNLPTKTFKLSELFEVHTASAFDAGRLKFVKHGIPFVGRTNVKNGVQGYLEGTRLGPPNPAHVISISQIGAQSAQYRETTWYASQNMFYLVFNSSITKDLGLYFVALCNKHLARYMGYSSYPTKKSIAKWELTLPIMNDHIATAEITHFMKLQARPLVDSATACMIGGSGLIFPPSPTL